MLDFHRDAHVYQKNGAAHLWNSVSHDGVATLWLDPGYGKTTIVLHAFKALLDAGLVKTMVVVAPLRVAQTVWAQEIEEWSTLNGLVACRLHGPKKAKWLDRRDVNIWIVNYEGVPWFVEQCKKGKIAQVDVVCFDEIRRMKNAQGKRFKAARPLTALAKYKWGLTGTPASNGLMDLFGQFLILDQGKSLGQYITKYRMSYFEQGYDGFTWIPRPGAQEAIEDRIKHYIYRADGFLDLPEFVNDIRKVVLPPAALKTYKTLAKNLLVEFGEEDGKITAANAAVLYGKLKQMSGGNVYDEDGNVLHVHDAKKEALQELLDELGDEQLLIAYEYNHELTQIREVLGDLPYLGSGVNEKTAMAHVKDWNEGKIRIMAAHPASAGHGLNLQKGGAHHLLWWGPTIDLDFYIQFNRRLLRQGNKSAFVVVHTFVAVGTVDESVIVSRVEKDGLQTSLLGALTAEFGDNIVTGHHTTTDHEDIMTDLNFKSDAQQPANPFAAAAQTTAPAAAANPFAGQGQGQPAQPAQAAPANPFAAAPAHLDPQAQAQQAQAIQQDVAAPPVPQPDPAAQPSNPFATEQTQPATTVMTEPVQPQEAAPAVEEAQVVEETPPVAAPTDTGWTEPATEAPQAAPTSDAVQVVPINIMVPVGKLDKVLSAIGRAVK